jgi:hypothetical protein
MASDYGSSSSELDDEPFGQRADESDTAASSSSDNILDDADAESRDSSSSTPNEEPPTAVTMTARAYQLEMLEESLKQNIIVAVDSTTPKTQSTPPADVPIRWTQGVARLRCKRKDVQSVERPLLTPVQCHTSYPSRARTE